MHLAITKYASTDITGGLSRKLAGILVTQNSDAPAI